MIGFCGYDFIAQSAHLVGLIVAHSKVYPVFVEYVSPVLFGVSDAAHYNLIRFKYHFLDCFCGHIECLGNSNH